MAENKTVNVIGAGLAGLSAAITLAEAGVRCNLISSLPSERAQSVLAEGGINAALDTMGEGDSTEEHFADTMKGGCFIESESAVRALTGNAPDVVRKLVRTGVPFMSENGRLILRNFGGQKKKRTAYAKSSTGKMIMTALIDAARRFEAEGIIIRLPHHELVGIDVKDGSLNSVTVKDGFTGKAYELTGSTILCTGGLNGFFDGLTTGTTQNTGNAAALAFAAGAEFSNLEFIQYHPTTVAISGKRMLISEAARGEGGRLYIMKNGKPWYFMEEKYPALGNLMPRDVVSREMTFVKERDDCEGDIFLDMTSLDGAVWDGKLSDMKSEITSYLHIDPRVTPIPVSPGIHFFMGGIRADGEHRTNIKGLFAAGEAACRYHGANRLGGNSMLAAVYGGSVAARSAAEEAENVEIKETEGNYPDASPIIKTRLCGILSSALGIVRTPEKLAFAKEATAQLLTECGNGIDRMRVRLGAAMIASAEARRESRGAHYRTDFPDADDGYKKLTSAKYSGGRIEIRFVPAEREAAQ